MLVEEHHYKYTFFNNCTASLTRILHIIFNIVHLHVVPKSGENWIHFYMYFLHKTCHVASRRTQSKNAILWNLYFVICLQTHASTVVASIKVPLLCYPSDGGVIEIEKRLQMSKKISVCT